MINKWILNNFKAINQQKVLNFRPLTIFTGANSSGKSTILQSILLVTQTLQDQIESRSIVLNGWFKKFGSYSDIVFHREDEMRNIKIGFDISDVDIYSVDFMRFVRFYRDINNASCSFVISSGGKKESLWPVLEELNLSSNMGTEGKEKTELRVVHNPDRSDLEVVRDPEREDAVLAAGARLQVGQH
ncbi:MAG: AAA family ATPase [Bacteroidaceae bacterium]|nr:AAA family ATPase [Bacteroidaceae bacterium]